MLQHGLELSFLSLSLCLLQMCTRSDRSGAWDIIVRGTTHSSEVRYVWCMSCMFCVCEYDVALLLLLRGLQWSSVSHVLPGLQTCQTGGCVAVKTLGNNSMPVDIVWAPKGHG